MEQEEWKDIPGYEGLYQVSSFGNVKSLPKFHDNNFSGYITKEKILKPSIEGSGYYFVNLYKNKKRKIHKLHQLVAIVFHNHKPNGYELVVNHIDNNKLNNHKDNINLIPQRENCQIHKTDVGIYKSKRANSWVSRIRVNKKQIHLGYYKDKEKALQIYQRALDKIHLFEDEKQFIQLVKDL